MDMDVEGRQLYIEQHRAELLEFMRLHGINEVPQARNIRRVIADLARHVLIEGPRAAITAMQDGFIQIMRRHFSEVTVEHLQQYYEPLALPLVRQILERLQCAEPNQDSVRVFGILSDFINRHRDDETLLRRFLHYATGSSNARGNQILVHVSQDILRASPHCIYRSLKTMKKL